MADSLDEQLRIMREMNRALRNMADATDSQQPDLGRQSKVFRQMFETIRDGFDKFEEIDLGGNGGPVSTLGVRINAFARGTSERASGMFDSLSDITSSKSFMKSLTTGVFSSELVTGLSSRLRSGTDSIRSGTLRGLDAAARGWSASRFGRMASGIARTAGRRIGGVISAGKSILKALNFRTTIMGFGMAAGFIASTLGAVAIIVPKILGVINTVVTGLAKIVIGTVVATVRMVAGIFSGLIDWAMGGGGGGGYRQAMEELRKEFGSFADKESAAVISSFRNLGRGFSTVAHTGKSVRRIFGSFADRLKLATEFAKSFGSTFTLFASEVESVGHDMLFLRKGLRLSDESIKGLAVTSRMRGKSIKQSMMEIATVSIKFAESFDMDVTKISRNMGEMTADTENFATLGNLVIGKLSVTAAKLGISVKEFTSIIEKYDNYEDAAKSASQLNQAFGMSIDARKMSMMQDPSQRLRMMQESFMLSGRAIEDMSRAEINLLATQSGLSAEGVRLAFSSDGLLMDHDEVSRKTPASLDQILPKSEVFSKLAESIDLVVGGGGQRPSGFLDAFIQGFTRGMGRSEGVRSLRRNIRSAIRATMVLGMEVGKIFMEFSSAPNFINMFTNAFNAITRSFESIEKPLIKFFKNITKNPAKAFSDLYHGFTSVTSRLKEDLSEAFGVFSESAEGSGSWLLTSIQSFITMSINTLADGVEGLTSFIRRLLIPQRVLGSSIVTAAAEDNEDSNGLVARAQDSLIRTLNLRFADVKEDIMSLMSHPSLGGGRSLVDNIYESFQPMVKQFRETVIPFINNVLVPALADTMVSGILLTTASAAAVTVVGLVAGKASGVAAAILGPEVVRLTADAAVGFVLDQVTADFSRNMSKRMKDFENGISARQRANDSYAQINDAVFSGVQHEQEGFGEYTARSIGTGVALGASEEEGRATGAEVGIRTINHAKAMLLVMSPSQLYLAMARDTVLQASSISLGMLAAATPDVPDYEDTISVISAELAKLPAVAKEMKKLPLATYNAHASLYNRAVEELQEFRDGLSNMRPIRMNIGLRNFSTNGQVDSFSESYSVNGTQVNINATVNTVMRATHLKNVLVNQNVVRAETNAERRAQEVKQSQMGIKHTGDARGSKRFTVGTYEDASNAIKDPAGNPISSGPETQDYQVTVNS